MFQKTTEATGKLVGNKISDKTTKVASWGSKQIDYACTDTSTSVSVGLTKENTYHQKDANKLLMNLYSKKSGVSKNYKFTRQNK